MSSYNGNYSSSPTVFLPPRHPSFDSFSRDRPFQSIHSSAWNAIPDRIVRPLSTSSRSRKRSRDAIDQEDLNLGIVDAVDVEFAVDEEPLHGHSMPLKDRSTRRIAKMGSQTGTWLEANMELEPEGVTPGRETHAIDPAELPERPSKSQRLEISDTPIANAAEAISASPSASDLRFSPPVTDAASIMLGVGWTVISTDESTQCAVRGWTKYIENHYPTLSRVDILLKSEGRQAYLVKAVDRSEGLYLFTEDLNEARFLAADWNSCVGMLRGSPELPAGLDSLRAVRTPAPSLVEAPDYLKSGQNGENGQSGQSGQSSESQALATIKDDGMDLD